MQQQASLSGIHGRWHHSRSQNKANYRSCAQLVLGVWLATTIMTILFFFSFFHSLFIHILTFYLLTIFSFILLFRSGRKSLLQ